MAWFGPSDGWDLLTPEQQEEILEWEDEQDRKQREGEEDG